MISNSIISKLNHIDTLLSFNEKLHQYIDTQSTLVLPSVTQVLKEYSKPFNADFWAFKKAKERGISKSAILREWNDLKEYGLRRGTLIHNGLEWYIKTGDIPAHIVNDLSGDDVKKIIAVGNDYNKRFIHIASERRVKNDYMAGTFDALAQSRSTGGIIVIDFKTDKKFRMPDDSNSMFNGLDLKECEFNKYSMQTSIYRQLLLHNGIETHGSCIYWIPENGYIQVVQTNDYANYFPHINGKAKSLMEQWNQLERSSPQLELFQ